MVEVIILNKEPRYYLQTDPKWKNISYSVPGEQTTIGESGCGPSSAAMILSTLTGKEITPVDTCAWALKNGYKALMQGTYYSYFIPQFEEYGIKCQRLNFNRMINQPTNPVHDIAFDLLKKGYYLIALMGPGLWTNSGHYVVVWWVDGVIHINDPWSTRSDKLMADIGRFKNECRMYWAIDAQEYNIVEDEDMTQEQFNIMMKNYQDSLVSKDPDDWSEEARTWAEEKGLIIGDQFGNKQYKSPVTREQMVVFLKRLADMQ